MTTPHLSCPSLAHHHPRSSSSSQPAFRIAVSFQRMWIAWILCVSIALELYVVLESHRRVLLRPQNHHLQQPPPTSSWETRPQRGLEETRTVQQHTSALLRVRGGDTRRSGSRSSSSPLFHVDFFANNGFSQAVGTTAVMGEYSEASNTTFFAYQGPHEDPYVISYNHSSNVWTGPIHVGTSLLGQLPDPVRRSTHKFKDAVGNNRGSPTLVIDSKGYIHISFGGDGGDAQLANRLGPNTLGGDYGSGRQIHVKSQAPHDIASWTPMFHHPKNDNNDDNVNQSSSISWIGSECQFVKVHLAKQPRDSRNTPSSGMSSSVDLYHICRHGARAGAITVQRSINDGLHWTIPTAILDAQERYVNNGTILIRDSWSCRVRAAGSGEATKHTIMVICSYHQHTNKVESRIAQQRRKTESSTVPHSSSTSSSYNGYYLELDTVTQQWRNVKGMVLNDMLPLTKERADAWIQVVSTEPVVDVMLNPEQSTSFLRPVSVTMEHLGHPHLLFQSSSESFTSEDVRLGTKQLSTTQNKKKLCYIGWTGHAWTEPVFMVSRDDNTLDDNDDDDDEDGDMRITVDPQGREILQVTTSMTNQTHSFVHTWSSRDHGHTWTLNRTEEAWLSLRKHHGRFHASSHIVNGRKDAQIVAYLEEPFVQEDDHTSMVYRKLYMIGEQGPVPRKRADAEVCRGVLTSEGGSMCASTGLRSNHR